MTLEEILRNPPDTYDEWMSQIRNCIKDEQCTPSSTGSSISTSSSVPPEASSSSASSSSTPLGQTLIDRWRPFVEANKFLGPTVKLLPLGDCLWAVLDHEYNFKDLVYEGELASAIIGIEHPPQRERPKPQLYLYDYETQKATPIINTQDIDI